MIIAIDIDDTITAMPKFFADPFPGSDPGARKGHHCIFQNEYFRGRPIDRERTEGVWPGLQQAGDDRGERYSSSDLSP